MHAAIKDYGIKHWLDLRVCNLSRALLLQFEVILELLLCAC